MTYDATAVVIDGVLHGPYLDGDEYDHVDLLAEEFGREDLATILDALLDNDDQIIWRGKHIRVLHLLKGVIQ